LVEAQYVNSIINIRSINLYWYFLVLSGTST